MDSSAISPLNTAKEATKDAGNKIYRDNTTERTHMENAPNSSRDVGMDADENSSTHTSVTAAEASEVQNLTAEDRVEIGSGPSQADEQEDENPQQLNFEHDQSGSDPAKHSNSTRNNSRTPY